MEEFEDEFYKFEAEHDQEEHWSRASIEVLNEVKTSILLEEPEKLRVDHLMERTQWLEKHLPLVSGQRREGEHSAPNLAKP